MKTILLSATLCALSLTAFAQSGNNRPLLDEQQEKLDRSQLSVDLRDNALQELSLTNEETIAFNEVYREYTEEKEELDADRRLLYNDFLREINENDGAKDERKETANFIEDYLDFQNKEGDIERKYFGKFEKDIEPLKVMRFYAMEDSYLSEIYRSRLRATSPDFLLLEPNGTDDARRR